MSYDIIDRIIVYDGHLPFDTLDETLCLQLVAWLACVCARVCSLHNIRARRLAASYRYFRGEPLWTRAIYQLRPVQASSEQRDKRHTIELSTEMAATDELTIDVRIEPPTSAGGGDEEQEQQEQDEDEYSQLVERLRSLVFSQDQDIDEIRRLIITRLPESACGEEDSIAPIRANLWSAMLLGLRPEDLNV